jgi:hypothetical protein
LIFALGSFALRQYWLFNIKQFCVSLSLSFNSSLCNLFLAFGSWLWCLLKISENLALGSSLALLWLISAHRWLLALGFALLPLALCLWLLLLALVALDLCSSLGSWS